MSKSCCVTVYIGDIAKVLWLDHIPRVGEFLELSGSDAEDICGSKIYLMPRSFVVIAVKHIASDSDCKRSTKLILEPVTDLAWSAELERSKRAISKYHKLIDDQLFAQTGKMFHDIKNRIIKDGVVKQQAKTEYGVDIWSFTYKSLHGDKTIEYLVYSCGDCRIKTYNLKLLSHYDYNLQKNSYEFELGDRNTLFELHNEVINEKR